jgi:lysine 2,3-aminomutase
MRNVEKIDAEKTLWGRTLSKGLITLNQIHKEGYGIDISSEWEDKIKESFDIRVPATYFEKKDIKALTAQYIPTLNELEIKKEELEDPIGDERWTPVEGITHRYSDRVLLKVTYLCAMYCRFCFRRYKVSKEKSFLDKEVLSKAIEYIKNHSEIWEVILTGGDPLVLTNQKLQEVLDLLSDIPHVKTIRFHTRIFTALPDRIDEGLLELLKQQKKSVWVVAHMNSHHEFTPPVKEALRKIREGTLGKVNLLLQSVFLKDVNDSFQALKSLFYEAIENGVKPYYLHYPDLAKGTHHFRVPLEQALEIFGSLRGSLSGICLPHFIVDIPGGYGKVNIDITRFEKNSDASWTFTSPLDGSKIRVQYPDF